jgi:hypothetical protein
VVALQPPLGLAHRARHHPVLLAPPGGARVGALVGAGVVALAAHPHEVVEAAVVAEAAPHVEGGVHHAHGVVAGLGEQPRQGREVAGEGLPAHVGVGEGAGKVVRAGGHGGERGDRVPVEDYRGAGESVEVGGADPGVPVNPQMVATKGVRDDDQHVGTDWHEIPPASVGCCRYRFRRRGGARRPAKYCPPSRRPLLPKAPCAHQRRRFQGSRSATSSSGQDNTRENRGCLRRSNAQPPQGTVAPPRRPKSSPRRTQDSRDVPPNRVLRYTLLLLIMRNMYHMILMLSMGNRPQFMMIFGT